MNCMREQFKDGVILRGRYLIEAPLNHGGFGVVFLARDLESGKRVAIKCLIKSSVADHPFAVSKEDQFSELRCHDVLGSHANIVGLLDHYETEAHVFLVLEYCANGDLFEAIRAGKGPADTKRIRALMLQLVDAVAHMHALGFAHLDIKPENLMLTEDGDLKLGDFGLVTKEAWSHQAGAGTERYMAPEQYDPGERGYSPFQADVWAVGITLINVVFGRNLFAVPNESDVHFADFLRDRGSLFDKYPTMTDDTFDVLAEALAVDPTKRSLAAFREALMLVDTFTTTEDDSLDFFCVGDHEIVPVDANRAPLPTPSIKPTADQEESFPWRARLLASPTQGIAQLSVIADVAATPAAESVPELESCGEDAGHDAPKSPSLVSVIVATETSSLALATPSVVSVPEPVIGGSLTLEELHAVDNQKDSMALTAVPASRPKPIPTLSSYFEKKGDVASKSWYDLCDEDESWDQAPLIGAASTDPIRHEQKEAEPQQAFTQHKQTVLSDPGTRKPTTAEGPLAAASRTITSVKTKAGPMNIARKRSFGTTRRNSPSFGFDGIDERDDFGSAERRHRPFIPRGRYSPTRKDINEKWEELGKRRRAVRSSVNIGAASDAVSAHHSGLESTIGILSRQWREVVRSSEHEEETDRAADLAWVGGWHDIE